METIRQGLVKRLHVDRNVIDSNRKNDREDPPITIQTSDGPIKCKVANIKGPSTFMYNPDKPLPCGARLWIETRAEVEYQL